MFSCLLLVNCLPLNNPFIIYSLPFILLGAIQRKWYSREIFVSVNSSFPFFLVFFSLYFNLSSNYSRNKDYQLIKKAWLCKIWANFKEIIDSEKCKDEWNNILDEIFTNLANVLYRMKMMKLFVGCVFG